MYFGVMTCGAHLDGAAVAMARGEEDEYADEEEQKDEAERNVI